MFILLLYSFIFLFGLFIGSFLNCIIYRLQEGKSFLIDRSYCPHCKHILNWQDLIPIFSFLWLRGQCSYCRQKISWQYPLVEFATAFLFILLFQSFFYEGTIYTMVYFVHLLILTCFLIIIFVYDLKHYIIPDKIIYPAIGLAFLYQLFRSLEFVNWDLFGIWNLEFGILGSILSAILASAFFLSIVLISKGRGMGWGDVKLAFLMGLILGWPNILVALFSAFFFGAIIGLGLIAFGKKRLSSEVPFGPFLVTGTFISIFFGERLLNWYINLFF